MLNQNESTFVCHAGTCFGGVQAEKFTLLDSHFLLFHLNAHTHMKNMCHLYISKPQH